MKVSTLLLAVFAILALSGCETMKNRIACDPAMKEMWAVSKYGPVGITQDINAEDAERACQAILLYNMLKAKQ